MHGAPDAHPDQPEQPATPEPDALSVIGTSKPSGLQRLAQWAPRLKEGQLKLLTFLAALTENLQHHSVRLSARELSDRSGVSLSIVTDATKRLEELNLITVRHGGTTRQNAYKVNFFDTLSVSKFETLPVSNSETPTNQISIQGVSEFETPPIENKRPTPAPVAVDVSITADLIDRLRRSKPEHFDQADKTRAMNWMFGYARKFGDNPNPHPPKPDMIAQLLAVASFAQLETYVFRALSEMPHPPAPPHNYPAWFVAIAIQRIHGAGPKIQAQARQYLKLVKAGQRQPEQQTFDGAADLNAQVAAIAGRKILR